MARCWDKWGVKVEGKGGGVGMGGGRGYGG